MLVPRDGYYEFKPLGVPAKKSQRVPKQPYAYILRSGELMLAAGLWKAHYYPAIGPRDDPSAWLQSFTILTTETNELRAWVHTRMPVLLHARDWDRWLARGEAHQLSHPPAASVRSRRHDRRAVQSICWQRFC